MSKRKRTLTDIKIQAERWVDSRPTKRWIEADYRSMRELLFAGYMVGFRAGRRSKP